MSECQGFRVLPEGGAEKIKGNRWLNSALFNTSIAFDTSNSIAFQVNGKQKILSITINSFNEVRGYLYSYPYVYGTEEEIAIIAAGPEYIDPTQFSYSIDDNRLTLCHFSGIIPPQFLFFNEDGTFRARFSFSVDAVTNPFQLPQEEFREETISIGNQQIGAGTVEITATNLEAIAALQNAKIIYAEGLGSASNAGQDYQFIATNYYLVQSIIPSGVLVKYYYKYGSSDPLIIGGVTSVNSWSVNSWGESDYPKNVISHEGRLVYAGTRTRPLTLFGSKVGDKNFLNQRRLADSASNVWTNKNAYSGSILATDPYVFTVAAGDDSEITNLRTTTDLYIGTDRKEYIASGGDSLLSALSVQIKAYTTQGSYPVRTAVMNDSVIYTDNTRKKVFAFKYNEGNGSYISQELSLLFNDLMEDDFVKQLAWIPHIKALYILTDKGNLYAITSDPQSETMAFYDTLERDVNSLVYVAAREDVATASSIHRGDHVFLYKNSGVYIFEQVFFERGVADSYVKIDMAKENEYLYLENVFDIVRAGASQYSINGQDFITGSDLFPIPTTSPIFGGEFRAFNIDTGEAVTISGLTPDGVNPWFLIDDESINGASRIIVGRISDIPKVLATMPIEAGQQWGSAQMGIKNIDELGIRHYKSYSYDISSDGETWQEVRVADKLGNCTIGRENTKFSSNHKYDQIIFVRSTKPEPLTITGINMRGVTNDG